MGLFGPSAMNFSVERNQRWIDFHGALQHPCERSIRGRPLEARQPPAGVDASTGLLPARHQEPVRSDETHELPLRRLAPAAGASPDGLAHAAGSRSSARPAVSDTCALTSDASTAVSDTASDVSAGVSDTSAGSAVSDTCAVTSGASARASDTASDASARASDTVATWSSP